MNHTDIEAQMLKKELGRQETLYQYILLNRLPAWDLIQVRSKIRTISRSIELLDWNSQSNEPESTSVTKYQSASYE
jgi:uncharacterized protein (UPF0216 family)